jgi:hypothetical protein
MVDDQRNNAPRPGMRMPGIGLAIHRLCMGCDRRVSLLNGAGKGVRWRCAGCLAKKALRQQTELED